MSDEPTVPRPTTMTAQRADAVPTLTIIAHSNAERVPSQLRIRGTLQLSRSSPAFAQRSDGLQRPLDDPYLSRSPIVIKPEADSIWILPGEGRIEIVVDGEHLTEPVRYGPADLERGVILTLHDRVALLLHYGADGPGREHLEQAQEDQDVPLGERRADVAPLLYQFARAELEAIGMTNLLAPAEAEQPWISARTVARLTAYRWPGGEQELREVVRQLVLVGRHQAEISLGSDLDALLRPRAEPLLPLGGSSSYAYETLDPPRAAALLRPSYRPPSEVSEAQLLEVLRAHAYRLAPTAKALNLSRTSLYALIERSSRIRKAADLGPNEILTAVASAGGKLSAAAVALEVSAHALKLRMRALGLSG